MTIKGKAYIVGAYEHPLRKAPDHSVAQLHAEVAKGARTIEGHRRRLRCHRAPGHSRQCEKNNQRAKLRV